MSDLVVRAASPLDQTPPPHRADPDKFPDGFAAVTAFIHGLGLKSGL